MACLLGYLWHNATPSTMLMGDAGSRAMGTLIAIAALVSGRPFVYLAFALVLMVDGGIGLVKVSLLRFINSGNANGKKIALFKDSYFKKCEDTAS